MKSVQRVARFSIPASSEDFLNWLGRRTDNLYGRLPGDDFLPEGIYWYHVTGCSWETSVSEREGVRRAWFNIEPRPRTLDSESVTISDKLPILNINALRLGSERCELDIEIVRDVGIVNPDVESKYGPFLDHTAEDEGAGHSAIESLALTVLWEINKVWTIYDQLPRDWREAFQDEWATQEGWIIDQPQTSISEQPKESSSTKYFKDADDYRSVIVDQLEQLIRSGEKDTQERLAEALGTSPAYPYVSDRDIRDWNSKFGLVWRDLQLEARARVRSLAR